MAISINFPDKILAGVHQSYTITSDEGTPSGTIDLAGAELDYRLIRLGAPKDSEDSMTPVMKYKVTFFLPKDSVGKEVKFDFQAGSSNTEDTKEIIES